MTRSAQPLDTKKLEGWLRQLEQALHDVSVIDRADIVMELNTHIRESFDRGDRTLDEILTSLGEPTQVSNRYRLERGMQPVILPRSKTPVGSLFKWATIGMLGLAAIIFIGGAIIVGRIFPLIQLDEKTNQIRLLGGMIDVIDDDIDLQFQNGSMNKSFGFHFDSNEKSRTKFSGKVAGNPKEKIKEIKVNAVNGTFDLEGESHSNELSYECFLRDSDSMTPDQFLKQNGKQVEFDFMSADVRCKLSIPAGAKLDVQLTNGDIRLEKLQNPLAVDLENGRIRFEGDEEIEYKLNANVVNGVVAGLRDFEEQQKAHQTGRDNKKTPKSYTAELKVNNGGISIQ